VAKIYGGRWRLLDKPPLGQGGQATVFRVSDETGVYQEDLALKRVQNPKRHDRFVREIEAIKRLTDPKTQEAHPNIISVIDHSALDDIENPDKQFLVMPIAQGGDLSRPGRLSLYKDSIDGILQVAKQVATALSAAHVANIIHRDVKPENILFTGDGHDLWLSDFGICLIRELPRLTESPEVMGPWAFMAPELAMGGELAVTPSADIYSLGKVIFYMLSGGVVIPREEIHEPRFHALFEKGERYRLLELLLRRMICVLPQRIAEMTEVMQQLEKIETWEQKARLIPMAESTLIALEKIQRQSLETARIIAENKDAREQETQLLGKIQLSVTAWLRAELDKLVPFISSSSITCEVRDAPLGSVRVAAGYNSVYAGLNGLELIFSDVNDQRGRDHSLVFLLCRYVKNVVTVTSGPSPTLPKALPADDLGFALLALYRSVPRNTGSKAPDAMFISQPKKIGTVRQFDRVHGRPVPLQSFRTSNETVGRISATFGRDVSLHVEFRASQWPGNEEDMRALIKDAVDAFVAQTQSRA